MSKNNKYSYWSTPTYYKKPKNFKVLDGVKRIYSCYIDIYDQSTGDYIDKLELKFKQINKSEIDKNWCNDEYMNNIGGYISYSVRQFERDRGSFDFINDIIVLNKNEYFKVKQRKEREKKLKRVLGNF